MSTIPHLAALRAYAAAQGITVSDERPIDHGYQLRLSRSEQRVGVNLYASGKILVQGGESALRRELEAWKQQRSGQSGAPSTSPAQTPGLLAPLPHIGVDESGKGDYFGPLAVAAVAMDAAAAQKLAAAGARDSKQLGADQVERLARLVRESCPHAIVLLDPEEYNRRHAALGANLNRLLAWAHAEAIVRVREQAPLDRAICDQFGDERLIERALDARGVALELLQRPRAEADIAVAAASLLARDAFVAGLERLSRAAGVRLPMGASDLSAIRAAGRQIVQQGGREALGRFAKLHWKTTQQLEKG
jgi:ribonuclease HIII